MFIFSSAYGWSQRFLPSSSRAWLSSYLVLLQQSPLPSLTYPFSDSRVKSALNICACGALTVSLRFPFVFSAALFCVQRFVASRLRRCESEVHKLRVKSFGLYTEKKKFLLYPHLLTILAFSPLFIGVPDSDLLTKQVTKRSLYTSLDFLIYI